MKKREPTQEEIENNRQRNRARMARHIVVCPHCQKEVLDHMTECPFCHGELVPRGYRGVNRDKHRKIRNVVFAVMIGVAAVIVLSLFIMRGL